MVNFGDKQAIAKLTLLLIYKIAYPKVVVESPEENPLYTCLLLCY